MVDYKYGWIDGWAGNYWVEKAKIKFDIEDVEPKVLLKENGSTKGKKSFGVFKNRETLNLYIERESKAFLSIHKHVSNVTDSDIGINVKQAMYNQISLIRALKHLFP
jgi:hypothetical protein